MIINRNFKDFKFRHRSKKNQIIYTSKKVKNDDEVINLIDNFLIERNSFIFESVEKGKIKGRYTIFGKNPDKIWEFNNKNSYQITNNIRKKIMGTPDKIIEKIVLQKEAVIFIAWGNKAIKKLEPFNLSNHYLLTAPHPSPLSSYRGFFGCRHFSKTNKILKQINQKTIQWV